MKTAKELLNELLSTGKPCDIYMASELVDKCDEIINFQKSSFKNETVKIMQVIHSLNLEIISSDLISDKTGNDLSDIMRKTLEKYKLLSEYQNYVKLFGNIPEF